MAGILLNGGPTMNKKKKKRVVISCKLYLPVGSSNTHVKP